jgi:UDP-4-keto-D-QuiNAc 4-reductase
MARKQPASVHDWPVTLANLALYPSSTPRILVTGANGFVGSALVKKLGCRGAVRHASAAVSTHHVATGELDGRTDWREALANIDVVIHTAARAHIMHERSSDPLLAFRQTNVNGTARLAEMAAAHGIKRFVFLSTIKVNGEETSLDNPFFPEMVPTPLTPYGQSKLEAEEVLMEIARRTSMEVVIVRPPLVYGPHVKGNLLTLLRCLHNGIPLPFERVSNLRSMIGLDNLVDIISTCVTHPKAAGQVFLVSDGEDFSTPDWIRHFALGLGRAPRLWSISPNALKLCAEIAGKGDAARSVLGSLRVSNDKVRNLLGWRAKSAIQEQVKSMCSQFIFSASI